MPTHGVLDWRKMAEAAERVCDTPGCEKPAKLKCPVCLKQEIEGSFFCQQDCFKAYWPVHKKIHSQKSQKVEDPSEYNPWPSFKYKGKLRPFPTSPRRHVPEYIKRPDYADVEDGYPASEVESKRVGHITILSPEAIQKMRVSSKLGREVLDLALKAVKPGVTTDELDRIVHEACIERDCYPSPLNYFRYPKSCCTSVNEVICHGIPDMRPLEDGDICNIDVTVYHDGYHGDLNETVFVGKVDEAGRNLVQVAYECLMKGIDIVKPGVKYRDIGNEIHRHASASGYSVVRTYCGHGINDLFHCTPSVPHYSKNKTIGVMKPGHTFTIEPMISEGTWKDVTWPDSWSASTMDGLRSAQFEHTLLVTETGCDILTLRPEEDGKPHFMTSQT